MKTEYPKLPKKFKEKWLTALRSGKYKQGEGDMLTKGKNDTFCCLGVGCKVIGLSIKQINNNGFPTDEINRMPNYFAHERNVNWQEQLAYMNDGVNGIKKKSFKQIANWIEKNL